MFDAVRGPSTHARSSRFEHVIQVLSFGTIVNGNSTRFAVGQTVRFIGRAIWDVRLFVPNKVHRHHRTDQGFPPRHRAVLGPRVWPRDPFGGGSCTPGYMLKLEAIPSSDWE